ncbi:hypothetical protein [Streptomyces sp. NPDC002553]|uniref:hypothetical protein n=1 Tax=Streptomyces sp. NPDC002553 TaxID=3154417 RepID=UPI00332BEC92
MTAGLERRRTQAAAISATYIALDGRRPLVSPPPAARAFKGAVIHSGHGRHA